MFDLLRNFPRLTCDLHILIALHVFLGVGICSAVLLGVKPPEGLLSWRTLQRLKLFFCPWLPLQSDKDDDRESRPQNE